MLFIFIIYFFLFITVIILFSTTKICIFDSQFYHLTGSIAEEFPDVVTVPRWLLGSDVKMNNISKIVLRMRPYSVLHKDGIKLV